MLDASIRRMYKQLLPKNFHGEAFLHRSKVRFFVIASLLFLFCSLLMSVIWLSMNEWYLSRQEFTVLGTSLVIQLSSILYFHYRGRLEFVAKNLIWSHYLLIVVVVLYSGGIYSPFIVTFIFMQVFSGFIINATHCKAMMLCNIVLLFLLSMVDYLHLPLPQQLIQSPESLTTVLNSIGLLLVVAVFAAYEVMLKALRTSMHNEKKRFLHQAEYEPLTGMLNFLAFENLLDSGLQQKIPFTLFYIDLNDFKSINQVFGHVAGDKVLQQVAARICNIIRNDDVVTRVKSDEFAVLVHNLTSTDECDAFCEEVKKAVDSSLDLDDGRAIEISCNVGYHSTFAGAQSKASLYAIAKSRMLSL